MIVEKNIGGKDYLFCDVPKDAHGFEMDGHTLFYKAEFFGLSSIGHAKELPEGNYSIVGKANELTNKQWEDIVELRSIKGFGNGFRDYVAFAQGDTVLHGKATKSGLSLIKSIGKEPETTLIILKN